MCISKLFKKKQFSEKIASESAPAVVDIKTPVAKTPTFSNTPSSVHPPADGGGGGGGVGAKDAKENKDKTHSTPNESQDHGKSDKKERDMPKTISPPKVLFAKYEPKSIRDFKDPAYATLDGDYPTFKSAIIVGPPRELDKTQGSVRNTSVSEKNNKR